MKYLLSILNKMTKKFKCKIVLYGRRMFNENNYELLKYLIENKYNKEYKIIAVTTDTMLLQKFVDCSNFKITQGLFSGIYHCLTAKYIFHTHGMGRATMKKVKSQKIVNLWHGTSLKKLGNDLLESGQKKFPYKDYATFMLATSNFSKEYFKQCYGYGEDQFFISGYPRNNALYAKTNILNDFNIDRIKYNKVIVFLPTFRKSNAISFINSNIDFPLLSKDNIIEFNDYLAKNRVLVIIKLHPLQNEITFLRNMSNIKNITNNDLYERQYTLYNLLPYADALITDYSSVYFDYLLLNKPIGFVTIDYKEYLSKRGFAYDNPIDYMPGQIINTFKELTNFIEDIYNNIDEHAISREKIRDLTNTYQEQDNCIRILNKLNISKREDIWKK